MSLFSKSKPQPQPSLDRTGTQAQIYPSEQQLWTLGPTINDPYDQGVVYPDTGQQADPVAERAWILETMNGETSNQAYDETWVNLENFGPAGFGPWTDTEVFQTGHSQNIVSNPAAEQGWGVGPARAWSHFPIVDLPNPYRNASVHMRNGELPWVTATSSLYERSQLAWEQQWAPYKRRSPVSPIVPVPQAVPFSQTVPTYGGGAVPHPGVDIPADDSALYGIYPNY